MAGIFSGRRLFVLGVLLVALAARLFIVMRGGEYYWADEGRYERPRRATTALWEGNFKGAARELLRTSGHVGFGWLAMVPAVAEHAVLGSKRTDARFCSGFFALFSVLNLFLIWRIATRFASSPWEPILALVFAASSNAFFFQTRHCFPYDASLAFFLVAVLLSTGPETRWQSARVGLCCGLGYLIYNGYWSVGAVVLVLDVVWRRERWLDRLRRAALGFAGLVTPLVVVFGAAHLAGNDLIVDAIAFADTVNQGDFGEGWRFPAEYLRIVDGPLWPILAVVIAAAVVRCAARREFQPWLRWVATVVLLYALWVMFCDVVPKFVLYGRTVRSVLPFLALAAAGAFELIRRSAHPAIKAILVGAGGIACLGGLWQMLPPLRQTFPRDFQKTAAALMADVRRREPEALLQTMFADYLSSPNFPEEPPPHRELLRQPHPHQYLPYLYEGYTREQRPLYYGRDIAMRVIQLDPSRGLHLFKRAQPSRWLAPYSGPVSLFLRLPKNATGHAECVLRAGDAAERCDRVLVHYLDSTHVQLGWSHGHEAPQLSEPVVCDYTADHAIGVSLGSLFPPAEDARFARRETLKALGRKIVLTFDGQTVLSRGWDAESATPAGMKFAPVPVAGLAVGAAASGGEDAPRGFSGQLYSVRQVDPRLFAEMPPSWRDLPIRGAFFGESQGVIELRLQFPADALTGSEPIFATGHSGAADLLYVSYQTRRHLRFHVDHWGTPSIQSGVVEIKPGEVHRLVISFGSLFPPVEDARYKETPHLRKLVRWLYLSLDGRVVFSRPFEFYACDPGAVLLGASVPGGTACAPTFTGRILEARRLPPGEIFAPAGMPPEP